MSANEPTPRSGRSAPGPRSGVPALSVLLTLLLPGAGHAYVGRPRRAACVFGLVNGLLVLGLLCAGPALAAMSPPAPEGASTLSDVRSLYHYDLLPEAANVSGTILAVRLFPNVEHGDPGTSPLRTLGLLLTALSGVGAALAAADAHFLARRPRGTRPPPLCASPGGVAAASFLVPGLGHALLGRRRKAILLFATLTTLFVVGLALSRFAGVDRDRHFYYWAGQLLYGGATIVSSLAFTGVRVREFLPSLDAGVLFTTAAGLLNVLVMVDAAATAETRLATLPEAK